MHRLIAPIGALVLSGCSLFGGLDVEAVATSYQKPSNVALYLQVTDDQPVPPLTVKNFRVFEGGQLVPAAQSQQLLLDRSMAAEHQTLLLLDLSGASDPVARNEIARGAARFVRVASVNQTVHVYGFDGREELVELGSFAKGSGAPDSIEEVVAFEAEDNSSNLYGAVIEAVHTLGGHLVGVRKPIRIGTVVVLLKSGDQAGRANLDEMIAAIEVSGYYTVAVGVGENLGETRLDDVGHDDTISVPAITSVGEALAQAGAKADAHYGSHYLLSYCSPARSGMRDLEVEIAIPDAEGGERTTSTSTTFDSTGFSSGCDPNAPPSFVTMTSPVAVEPIEPAPEEPADEETAPPPPAAPKPSPPAPVAPPEPKPTEPAPSDTGDSVVPPPASPDYAPD